MLEDWNIENTSLPRWVTDPTDWNRVIENEYEQILDKLIELISEDCIQEKYNLSLYIDFEDDDIEFEIDLIDYKDAIVDYFENQPYNENDLDFVFDDEQPDLTIRKDILNKLAKIQ